MDDLQRVGNFLRTNWVLVLIGAAMAGLSAFVIVGLQSPNPRLVVARMYVGWFWIALILAIAMGALIFHPRVHGWVGGRQNAHGHARTLSNWLVRWFGIALVAALVILGWQKYQESGNEPHVLAHAEALAQKVEAAVSPAEARSALAAQPAAQCAEPSMERRTCDGLTAAPTAWYSPAEGVRDAGMRICANKNGQVAIEDPIDKNGQIHFRFRAVSGVVNGFRYQLVNARQPCPDMDT